MNHAMALSKCFEKGLLGALFLSAEDDLRAAKPRVL